MTTAALMIPTALLQRATTEPLLGSAPFGDSTTWLLPGLSWGSRVWFAPGYGIWTAISTNCSKYQIGRFGG